MNVQATLPGVTGTQNVRLSQWFTERKTAERIVEFALRTWPGGRNPTILEPSCGNGSLLRVMLEHGLQRDITAIDIDPELAEHCKRYVPRVMCADFLEWDPTDHFDIAIMNPPFEDGQTESHILKALTCCTHVVCHGPLTTLATVERGKNLWAKVDMPRLAICSSRPKYGAKGGATEMMTIDVLDLEPGATRGRTMLEWWP
jgi:predicted RNA methylase